MLQKLRPFLLLLLLPLAGCQTTGDGVEDAQRMLLQQSISAEPPGNYWVGRRSWKEKYYYWGWVRKPGQPWSSAKMVMLNEQQTLAPDRVAGKIGVDNGTEYRLYGNFSGDKVYEPASNSFYPEFVLDRYEVVNTNPPPLFTTPRERSSREVVFY